MGIIVGCENHSQTKEVSMFKFKFHCLNNTLSLYQAEDIWHQIPEENQFTTEYGNLGFKLSPSWITFTIYENKIDRHYDDQRIPGS